MPTQPAAAPAATCPVSRRWGARLRRALGAGAAACLALTTVLALGPTSRADDNQPAAPGLEQFGACLSGQGKGSMLLLMDQSGSLSTTDPGKDRVTAAQYLVRRLESFSRVSGISLDVRVAGFAADYAPQGQWATLDQQSLSQVESSISQAGDAITDYDTDYWTALEGARQDLADHDSGPCQAITWFSDGAFDLDVRDSASARKQLGTTKPYAPGVSLDNEAGVSQAEQLGAQDLCRDTGLADQLRSSGITLLGVGLSTGEADFGLMRRVVSGGGDNAAANGVEACGQVSEPAGAFYQVSDIDSLLLAFDSISAPGKSVSGRTSVICQGVVCQEGRTSFVLDGSLEEVHILASADVAGLEGQLFVPGAGSPIVMPSTTKGPQSSQGVSYEWITDRSLQIDLKAADLSAWDGQWQLAFVDTSSSSKGKQVRTNIHLSSPLAVSWQNLADTTLRQGEAVDDARLVLLNHAGGQEVDPSRIKGSLTYSLVLTDSQGQEHTLLESSDLAGLASAQTVTVPAQAALGTGVLTTSATVTTAAISSGGETIPGTTLSPTLASVPVVVNPPANFPTLGDKVDFGRLEEETSASAALALTGPGCVWLAPDATTLKGAPAEAGDVTVSTQATDSQSCVRVAEGEQGELGLTLSAQDHANGAVSGTIMVSVSPLDDPGRVESVEVPFKADMRRPLDVGTAWATFILVLLVGVGLPLILLYLLRFLAGRIPAGPLVTALKVVELPQPHQRADISVQTQDLEAGSVTKPVRELDVRGYRLRVRLGWSPTSVPQVRLVSPDLPSVAGQASDAAGSTGSKDSRALLPLSVRGSWVAVADQPDSPRHVSVLVIADQADRVDAIVAKAAERLGAEMAAVLPEPAQPQQEAPQTGGQGSGGNPFAGTSTGGAPPSYFTTPGA